MIGQKLLLVCTMSVISLPVISLKTHAEGISDFRHQNNVSATKTRMQVRDFYTPRQKRLARDVRKIADFYYQKTGKAIPVNSQSIKMVMKILGAVSEEKSFIKEHMIANSNAQANIIRLDTAIHRARNLLKLLE